jgi:hypothetical protein
MSVPGRGKAYNFTDVRIGVLSLRKGKHDAEENIRRCKVNAACTLSVGQDDGGFQGPMLCSRYY